MDKLDINVLDWLSAPYVLACQFQENVVIKLINLRGLINTTHYS